MKNIFFRFILVFSFVFTNLSLCFASDIDFDCSPNSASISSYSQAKSAEASDEDCQSDQCICVICCHEIVGDFSSDRLSPANVADLELLHTYKFLSYPEIYYLLEKPPII